MRTNAGSRHLRSAEDGDGFSNALGSADQLNHMTNTHVSERWHPIVEGI